MEEIQPHEERMPHRVKEVIDYYNKGETTMEHVNNVVDQYPPKKVRRRSTEVYSTPLLGGIPEEEEYDDNSSDLPTPPELKKYSKETVPIPLYMLIEGTKFVAAILLIWFILDISMN